MTTQDFIDFHLKKKIRQQGSVKAVARWIGCSDVYVHFVLKGVAAPGKKMLDAFNLERVQTIRKKS